MSELRNWLKGIGLPQYAGAFEANDIDLDLIRDVDDQILKDTSQEHGVVGETPNLAARLQALAEPGQIVISHDTKRLIGGLFEYIDLGTVTLKGLVEPVQAWQVRGTSGIESRFEAQHQTNLIPLVGREEELELQWCSALWR